MSSPIDSTAATHRLTLRLTPVDDTEHRVVGKFQCDTDGRCADGDPNSPPCPGTAWLNSAGPENWHQHYSGPRLSEVRSGPVVLTHADYSGWRWRYHQPGTFVRYIEHNEQEGQTWSFWLQREGNSDALEQLETALDRLAANVDDDDADPDFDSYELRPEEVETGTDVDLLCAYGAGTDFDQHTKVIGRLVVPDNLSADALKKGGIRSLFKDPVRTAIDITPDADGIIRWARKALSETEPGSASATALRNVLRECGVTDLDPTS